MGKFSENLPIIYLILWLILAIWSGYKPADQSAWFFEFIFVFAFVLVLFFTYKKFRFSNWTYTAIFVFLCLPLIGGHYTYSEIPFGYSLSFFQGGGRNNYDRLVHLSFGLLMAVPAFELAKRKMNLKGFWLYLVPFCMILTFSGLYEMSEWFGTVVLSREVALTWLAAQGDAFDAQKDTFLAALGSLITLVVIFVARLFKKSDDAQGFS